MEYKPSTGNPDHWLKVDKKSMTPPCICDCCGKKLAKLTVLIPYFSGKISGTGTHSGYSVDQSQRMIIHHSIKYEKFKHSQKSYCVKCADQKVKMLCEKCCTSLPATSTIDGHAYCSSCWQTEGVKRCASGWKDIESILPPPPPPPAPAAEPEPSKGSKIRDRMRILVEEAKNRKNLISS